MRRTLPTAAALAALLLYGCVSDSSLPEATGKGAVRAINAIQTAPQISFLIEERSIGTANYKGSTAAQQFDDLEYTFNFEAVFPGVGVQRVASQFLDVVADKDYTFVASGSLANPTITIWEGDVRTFGAGDTVFEARFGHAAATPGDIDVYFAAPGIVPALGQQVATLVLGEVSPPADYAEGDYVLILTAAGDPADVLFTSATLTPAVGNANTFVIFDGDADELGSIAVRQFGAGGGALRVADVNLLPTVRFIHASMALATSDIYDDAALTTPIVTNHAFGEVSAEIALSNATNTITYTNAGDTSVILFEDEFALATGTRNDYVVVGETDALNGVVLVADRRSVETIVKFSFTHTATNHPTVDLYVVDADADITDLNPLVRSAPVSGVPLRTTLAAGSFDIYLTTADEKTVLAGPVRIDPVLGDVIDLFALENVDPAIADLVFIPPP